MAHYLKSIKVKEKTINSIEYLNKDNTHKVACFYNTADYPTPTKLIPTDNMFYTAPINNGNNDGNDKCLTQTEAGLYRNGNELVSITTNGVYYYKTNIDAICVNMAFKSFDNDGDIYTFLQHEDGGAITELFSVEINSYRVEGNGIYFEYVGGEMEIPESDNCALWIKLFCINNRSDIYMQVALAEIENGSIIIKEKISGVKITGKGLKNIYCSDDVIRSQAGYCATMRQVKSKKVPI